MSETPTAKSAKVIKRYANRKLYDTERSCYVTLEEISQMIKDGDDIKVVDNKSKDDLTAVTLAQIIVEEEKKVQKMPLKLLKSIIRSGNEAIGDFYEKRVHPLRDDVERRVDSLLRRDGDKGDKKAEGDKKPDADKTAEGAPEAEARAGLIQDLVSSTTEAVETWQKRVDERVRETLGRMAPKPAPDLEALRGKVEHLEARLRSLEAKKT